MKMRPPIDSAPQALAACLGETGDRAECLQPPCRRQRCPLADFLSRGHSAMPSIIH